MRYSLFILFVIIISMPARAQVSAPKHANEFLAIGVGARALAMSNTQVTVVDDVTAGFWNPAGLLQIEDKYEASLMHAEYFAGIAKFDYAAFATAIDSNSHIAISAIRFGVDDIPDTRFLFDDNGTLNYDNVRFFSVADYAFLFSYARKFPQIEGLRVGGSFKVIYRNVGSFANAWGLGIDVGAQLERNGWLFGLVVRDVTTTFNIWTINTELLKDVFIATGNELPDNSIEIALPRLIGGVARRVRFSDNFGLLAAVEADITTDGRRNTLIRTGVISIDPHAGMEADYKQTVFLRFGVGNIQQIKDFDGSQSYSIQPNFGLGVRIKQLSIDYALTNIGDLSESLFSHVFSLKLGLNKI